MKPVIRNLLRSSVYQLKYMDSVPDYAVCSEAVKLAVRKGFSGLRGYVNGVLRNVVRKMDEIEYPKEDVQRLSVKFCPGMDSFFMEERIWGRHYREDGSRFSERGADYDPMLMNRVTPEGSERKTGSRRSESRSDIRIFLMRFIFQIMIIWKVWKVFRKDSLQYRISVLCLSENSQIQKRRSCN